MPLLHSDGQQKKTFNPLEDLEHSDLSLQQMNVAWQTLGKDVG